MFANMGDSEEAQQLNIIIKADVQGSVEDLSAYRFNNTLPDAHNDILDVFVSRPMRASAMCGQ